MRLITWNEKNKPDLPAWQVTSDCDQMAEKFKSGPTIIGGQEFGETADMVSLTKAFSGWTLIGKGPIPMLMPPDFFRVIDSGYVKTHSGMPKISPERGFIWALVKRRRRLVKPFIVVNTHYVSGAFNKDSTDVEWRLINWATHHRILTAFVAQKNAAGYDVFVMGDMNKLHYSASAFGVNAYTMAQHGLDNIIACPAKKKSFKRIIDSVYTAFLYTDHKPVVAEFSFMRF